MWKKVCGTNALGVFLLSGWLAATPADALEFSNCYGNVVSYDLSGVALGPHHDKLCTDPEREGSNFRSPSRVHSDNRMTGGELVLSGSMRNSVFSRVDGTVTLEVDGEKDERTLTIEKGEAAFKVAVRVPAGAKSGRFNIRHVGVNPYGNIVSTVSGDFVPAGTDSDGTPEADPAPAPPSKALTIELNIAEGQVFTQGDSMPVKAWVRRGESDPVKGAAVEIFVFSPAGRLNGSAVMYTDGQGQGRMTPTLAWWPAFFTVCATPGSWRVEAAVRVDSENAGITRKVELVELKVSTAQVAANIWRIVNMWERGVLAVTVKNGMDEPFIAALHGPKGPMVTMRAPVDARFRPYANRALTADTLRWLNGMRFSDSAATRRFMAGVDYGPVYTGAGLGQMAVAVYPRGETWDRGHVLDAWWHQEKRVYTAGEWMSCFSVEHAVRRFSGAHWDGQYPTTGSDGGYYHAINEGGGKSDLFGRTRVLTYSPVEVLATDDQGRRVGRLPDGRFTNEISGSEHIRAKKEDGTFVNFISLPDTRCEVSITGTGSGSFHLAAGNDKGVVNFGRQPIETGAQATLLLVPGGLEQPLVMPGGARVQPRPGFPDAAPSGAGQSVTLTLKTSKARPDEKIAVEHSALPDADVHAWIAFYENGGDRDQDYLHYTFLRNLTDRVYDVAAPHRAGDQYHFRIFLSEGYGAACRSDPVTITP